MPENQEGAATNDPREWWQVALSSIGDAVITTDVEGRITFLNPVAQTVTGWPLGEASGLPLEAVFHIINEETRQAVENPVVKALREGVAVGLANHTLLIAKGGAERPIDDSAAPIRNLRGEVIGVVLVFRDITERRKAERALQESEERFRLLVEGTQDYAIFMLDPQGNIASWNTGAQRIKGYRAEEIIGRHFSSFYPREAVERGWPDEELRRAAADGRFEDEGWRVRKDGTQFWANVIITALRDKAGALRGFSKITRDLTERRQLERAKLNAEVMADLSRRKDEFLAMLSHELRNPLSPILNSVQLLRLDENRDALHQEATTIIERQTARLARLVDDLLEVSRVTTGRIRLQRAAVDLRRVAEHAIETARPLIEQRRHELAVSLPPDAIWLFADATRLEQVIVNLLTNAAKYTDPGGRIELKADRTAEEATLRVRDNGIGIAADFLPSIFDLFTQAPRSIDRSQGGLGVGLTVVRRIVDLHHGSVEAISGGLGQGSEFVVRLPLMPPQDPSAATDQPAAQPARQWRVLVVDDNQDAAETAALLLRRAGHEVRTAYSGGQAVEAALADPPDAILLDLGLPEIDGYEVARRLRRKPAFDEVLLVALTGYGQESDRRRSQDAGCDAHLVKPVNIKKIEEVLESLAGQRRRS
ncbi:MAG TPA: PAS domain S-box protein [Pirellulales bacterium]